MTIYIDEDLASDELAGRLRKEGYAIQAPAEANAIGASDPRQLAHAIRTQAILLTRNFDDFEDLHNLVRVAGGKHPGIFTTRQENNVKRDMRPAQLVAAIRKACASGAEIANQLIILNHWR